VTEYFKKRKFEIAQITIRYVPQMCHCPACIAVQQYLFHCFPELGYFQHPSGLRRPAYTCGSGTSSRAVARCCVRSPATTPAHNQQHDIPVCCLSNQFTIVLDANTAEPFFENSTP
jgi:hypothetical protein